MGSRYSRFILQYAHKQFDFRPVHLALFLYGLLGRDDGVCTPCLFGGPSEGIDKGGDRLILLDIGVFCLETFAADDNRADQGQPAVLTLLGAMLLFGERLNLFQWVGVLLSIASFYLLSSSGKKEGIHFAHNKWIFFTVLSILTGAMSGLYDKHLMRSMDVMTVQVWF